MSCAARAAGEVAVRHAECPREAELLDSLHNCWPEGCPDGLCSHAEACAACGSLLEVALALRGEHAESVHEASVPSSAVMWWRLQMRARREATVRAFQPIAVVQAVTLACAVGDAGRRHRAASCPTRRGSPRGWTRSGRVPQRPWPRRSRPRRRKLLSPGGIALGLAGALFLVVTPVAVYLALERSVDWPVRRATGRSSSLGGPPVTHPIHNLQEALDISSAQAEDGRVRVTPHN